MIVVKKPEELIWDFCGEHPYYRVNKLSSDFYEDIKIDPFPCTSHNMEIIKKEVEVVERHFPIGSLLQWIIIPHEFISRSNAYASYEEIWRDERKEKNKLDAWIVFCGKRTNIHPAMTKFLVSHEYGHQVDYWITHCMMEEEKSNDRDIFRKKWAEVRGIEWSNDEGYGAGRYHNSITEMIADEFRVVVMDRDTDFWQHDVYKPDSKGKDFWFEMYEKYKFKG